MAQRDAVWQLTVRQRPGHSLSKLQEGDLHNAVQFGCFTSTSKYCSAP